MSERFRAIGIVAACLSLLAIGPPAWAKKEYCAFLTPEDFNSAGVAGAGKPTIATDEAGAFCVYAGKSSATGGIEFDIFVPGSPAEADAVWMEVRPGQGDRTSVAKSLPGVEFAEVARISGKVSYTALGVKRGRVVFHIGVPTTPKSQEAVLALAKLVLQRTEKLGR